MTTYCNWYRPPNGSPVGFGVEYRSAYLDMISMFRSLPTQPKEYLAIPPPLVNPPTHQDQPPPFHMQPVVVNRILRDMIPSIAKESNSGASDNNYIIIDTWSALGGTEKYQDATMTCDGCHPRDKAAAIIAQSFAAVITSDEDGYTRKNTNTKTTTVYY